MKPGSNPPLPDANPAPANIVIGATALITCDNWFVAPDGRQYRAVFGTVKAVRDAEQTLGIKVNLRSADWYVEIGNLTLAGCQIHYAIRCDSCSSAAAQDYTVDAKRGLRMYERPSHIYFADEPA